MVLVPRPRLVLLTLSVALLCFSFPALPVQAGPKATSYWQVDDIRAGMKGQGRTVMKGTKVENFDVEILGVMKNTSPGRDMILARLSGLGLEKTGVIAGMSGSPVYIDDKLVGAVAYAWPFGKEPIAGITPFAQMHQYVEAFERRDVADKEKPTRVGLRTPVIIDGKEFGTVTVAQSAADVPEKADDSLFMAPLQTPLAATGFTPYSLKLLRDRGAGLGLVPMQGGGAPAKIADDEKDTPLQIGGPLAVTLISGDFDLSGIGTVTHIEGERVYGFGHPFMSLGGCELPLMTGYIHTVYPRQTVSFKMGSPLKPVGVINADVSTCIAGWLGRKADMMPLRMTVALGEKEQPKTFNVQIARQPALLGNLVYTALTNSVDMEGELPDELTAEFTARLEIEGQSTLVLKDTFSGMSGGRAPAALYGQVAAVVSLLTQNPYKTLKIRSIECDTVILPGRKAADIDAVELDSDTYSPGDTIKAHVFLKPYRGARKRVTLTLKLPADLPEGNYAATICDDLQNARFLLRENPNLIAPQTIEQLMDAVNLQLAAKRTSLVLRVSTGANGVSIDGKALPNLPPSMVTILGNSKRSGAQAVGGSLVSRQPTEWVVQGGEIVKFTVTKNNKIQRTAE